MKRFSAKNKIYFIIFLWVIIVAVAFGYVFPLFNSMSDGVYKAIHAKSQDLGFLEVEQQNFKQSKSDLDRLEREPYHPDQFFNKDVTLVNEVRELEDLAERMSVKIVLSGLRGTLKDAGKAKTKGEVFTVPFNLTVEGSLGDVVAYIETLENAHSLVSVNNISLNAGSNGNVVAAITANFFLKK